MALGSRLRQTSDRLTQEAAKIYQLYGLEIEPRWFPVLYTLSQQDNQSVAQLAVSIGHSQASVSQIVKEMQGRGYVHVAKSADDGRKTIVTLSEKTQQQLPLLQEQIADVAQVVDVLLGQMQHNIWQALDELDYLLDQQSMLARTSRQRKQRESGRVEIVAYEESYHDSFRRLNQEWITTYFTMEAADYQALDHPYEKIIQPGGCILMALYDGEAVGTCALLKMDDETYELAKMAVSPRAQGRHVGWLLGQAVLEKAKQLGATTVYLESNTILKPAISLYHKLGFERVKGPASPYKRCNIQMKRIL
ncbi:GNAT family N-acetyltransferase [Spirosoma rhododendri]|uniref:GNAT family N-acetyltransferase n=2 Tax=Spirosoma rhododendri TaxID=2728024 RepID=A0A7L5DS13_9BACT|nr:GNAT family N-acetyltransferase [Spirosoma rhododendri]